jgi:DegV family protein with EDD domain
LAKVRVVTDSTVCLPHELVKRYEIGIVPLRFIYEEKVYRDGLDISADEIYRILPKARRLPTTSSPAPGDYLEVMRRTGEGCTGLLVLTISPKLSSMIEAARNAADMLREERKGVRVEVLDSGTAAGAEGLVALAAARAAQAGGELDGVVAVARTVMAKVRLLACVDTLYYLAKGGRVPKAVAWANAVVKVKPILQIAPLSGETNVVKVVRTKAQAGDYLVKMVKEMAGSPAHVLAMHSASRSEAEELAKRLWAEVGCGEVHVVDFTPGMGIHSGPGVLGVAFYGGDE